MSDSVSLPDAPSEPLAGHAAAATQVVREISELLEVRWLPFARFHRDPPGRYALMMRWPQGDPRWELYQKGELGEPFDMLGLYESVGDELAWRATDEHPTEPLDPLDVLDATTELLGRCDNRRRSVAERLRVASEHNRALKEKRRKDVVDDTVHGVRLERPRLGKGGKRRRHVAGSDISNEKEPES